MANERPRIVTLCGSTRFYEAFQQANYQETMAGRIVLSVGFYPHSAGEHEQSVGCTPKQKVALDELHKRKIDLSDEILVLDCDLEDGCLYIENYIGVSTRSEIKYAQETGKRIRYWSQEQARKTGYFKDLIGAS